MEYSIYQKKYNPQDFTIDKHYEFLPGKTIIKTKEKVEFESEQVIYGHDVTHPVIANFMNQIGLGFISQTSNVNEAIVLGLSLELIPEFRSDFRGSYMNDEEGEIKRVRYLIDSFSKNALMEIDAVYNEIKVKEINRQTDNVVEIFILALRLGKLLKNSCSQIGSTWSEVYKQHKDWYFNAENESEFSLKVGSENQILLADEERKIVEKISNICNKLPHWTYIKDDVLPANKFTYFQRVFSTFSLPEKNILMLNTRSQFFRSDTVELDSTITVEGHDITHAIITSYMESIGVEKTSQGAIVNEALVAGVGFKAIQAQRAKYDVPRSRALKFEEEGFEAFALKILKEGFQASINKDKKYVSIEDYDLEFKKNTNLLIDIFRLSRYLGKIIKTLSPEVANKWNDLFISHMEFIKRHENPNINFDETDSQFSIITWTESEIENIKKYKSIVDKLNILIYQLPDYMRYGFDWNN